jgi:hypothetical protein
MRINMQTGDYTLTPDEPSELAAPAGCPGGQCYSLKAWPGYFRAIADGTKTFEARKDDRDFQVGDTLRIQEWKPMTEEYTGAEVIRRVSYILKGPQFGIEAGWCVMALAATDNE